MTTATLQKGQVITVSAIVQGYESKDGRERVLLDIPDFHSQHDTKVDVTPEQKLAMPAGVAVNLTLRRENMSSEKYKDRPYGWYYGLESIGEASAPAAEPAPAPQDEARAPAREQHATLLGPTLEPPTLHPAAEKYSAAAEVYSQWHMNRRTALMQATEAVLKHPGTLTLDDDLTLDDVILTASDRRFAWLQGTPAPDTDPGHLVRAAVAMGAQEPEPQIDESQAPTDAADLPF